MFDLLMRRRTADEECNAFQAMLISLRIAKDRSDLVDRVTKMGVPIRPEYDRYVRFSKRGPVKTRVDSSEDHEANLICWERGQFSPTHDHCESDCVMYVLEGRLTEIGYREAPEGRLEPFFVREMVSGDWSLSRPGEIHRVANLGDDRAVTLHVYSPLLNEDMNTYVPTRNGYVPGQGA